MSKRKFDEMAAGDQYRETVLAIITSRAEGCTQEHLEASLAKIDGVEEDDVQPIATACINSLLSQGYLELLLQDGQPLYKEIDIETANRLRGLSTEEQAAYHKIKETKDLGIWTRDLKRSLHITQTQKFDKMMKKLLEKQLIKTVKGITGKNKNRIYYMLYELEPAADLTGGPWYTAAGDYNTELIENLKDAAYRFVVDKGKPIGLTEIANYISVAGVSDVQLQQEHIQSIVNVLVLDGRVEISQERAESKYRAGRLVAPSSALTDVPCGVCLVRHRCTPGGKVNPEECQYLSKWLEPLTD